MPDGGEITVLLKKENLNEKEFLLISFKDNGCGMGGKIKKRIFEPFFTTKEKGRGTGLGLATVYGIINKNNGKIEFESEIGKGTTFKIYFPVNDKKEILQTFINNNAENKKFKGNQEKILVVDDEKDLTIINKRILEKNNYKVYTANSITEAMEIVSNQKIDLIITDVILGDGNGGDLFRKIEELGIKVLFIFVTGYSEDDIPPNTIPESFPLLKKPFSFKEFLKIISLYLNKEKKIAVKK